MTGIRAIILAAGESRRMGTQKLLLPFRGKTIIENVVDNVLLSGISDIVVVSGADHEAIYSALQDRPVRLVYNENFRDGMFSSVKCGVDALPEEPAAFMLFLGDQPFIPVEVIHLVAEAWYHSKRGIIIPVYNGFRGHPILIDGRYKKRILNLDPEIGLRSLAEQFPEDVFETITDFPEIIRDIDSKNDYFNELNKKYKYGRKNSF